MSEMLLQSHLGEIHLLPALPDAWADGFIKGIKGRGGYTVDMEWAKGKLKSASISCIEDKTCKLRTSQLITISGVKADMKEEKTVAGTFYTYTFSVKKGVVYKIKA
jgi:alpha-L-fucosidase 2